MRKGRGIVYLMMGKKHLARLTVSLFSLRKVYSGPVTVLSDDTAKEYSWLICSDPRIQAEVLLFEPERLKRNSHYVTKTKIHRHSPYEETLFLDADTMPVGKIDDLWPRGNEIVLTKFANWQTNGRMMAGRIKRWEEILPEKVRFLTLNDFPAINTGVFAFRSECPIMDPWYDLTKKNPIFIADEIAMQLLYLDFEYRLLDDRFNCSPLYGENKDRAVIWHFHGGKHMREQARDIWQPVFQDCWDKDIGKIKVWAPAGDEALEAYFKSLEPKL